MPGRSSPSLSPLSRPPPSPPDRTTLIVRLGLLLMLFIGVASIFGDSLMALVAPK